MASSAFDLNAVASQSSNNALSAVGNVNSTVNQLLGIQNANNATSAQMAADQRDWSARQAELTRQFNSAEAQKNRDWQAMQSNTAHQREVNDLIAAGLNPVLSAMNGNGASVTSGSTASSSNPSGASSQADTSLSSALVSLLSNSLQAMTSLASMSTSALTNSAVADKYTAAQRYAAELSSSASMYGANMSASTARDIQAMRQAQEIFMAQNYPTSLVPAVSAFLQSLSQGATGSSVSDNVGSMAYDLTHSAPSEFGKNISISDALGKIYKGFGKRDTNSKSHSGSGAKW
nr:MAG TPA: minor capsid protein [Microviridae sp.]